MSFLFSDLFASQDVDLKMFLSLGEADFKELGIKLFGHRKKLMMVIQKLKCKLI